MLDNFSSDLHRVKSFSVLVYLEFNNLGRVIFKVWHLTFQPTTQTLVHHQIIHDYQILCVYTYIYTVKMLEISTSQFFVFCSVVAYCTQLLSSYVQPDDGHHYGRKMQLLATSTIQLHNNNNNIVVFDYLIHYLYTRQRCLKCQRNIFELYSKPANALC